MQNSSRKENYERWKELIEQYEKSGLTLKSFWQQKDIALPQLCYYRGILQTPTREIKNDIACSFTEVKIKSPSIDKEIRINLPNGFQCFFPSTIDSDHLKSFLKTILSC